jgi:hypothetical protein
VFDALTKKVTVRKAAGVTKKLAPLGSPCLKLPGMAALGPGESRTFLVQFINPRRKKIAYTPRVVAGEP